MWLSLQFTFQNIVFRSSLTHCCDKSEFSSFVFKKFYLPRFRLSDATATRSESAHSNIPLTESSLTFSRFVWELFLAWFWPQFQFLALLTGTTAFFDVWRGVWMPFTCDLSWEIVKESRNRVACGLLTCAPWRLSLRSIKTLLSIFRLKHTNNWWDWMLIHYATLLFNELFTF